MIDEFLTLKKFSHKVGKNFWHVEFATKYRYKMFIKEKQHNLANAYIQKTGTNNKIKIHILCVVK